MTHATPTQLTEDRVNSSLKSISVHLPTEVVVVEYDYVVVHH